MSEIAREQHDCSSLLSDLLDRFAYEDYAWVEANASVVGQACAAAESDFARFKNSNGG
jgi:hypothetical protein